MKRYQALAPEIATHCPFLQPPGRKPTLFNDHEIADLCDLNRNGRDSFSRCMRVEVNPSRAHGLASFEAFGSGLVPGQVAKNFSQMLGFG